MNEKEKDTIILKSMIKKKYNMKMKYTEHKGVNCVYYEKNNYMIWKYYRAYNFDKRSVVCCLLKMNKYFWYEWI